MLPPAPDQSPVHFFDALLNLLLNDHMTEAEVRRQLKPFTRAFRQEAQRVGRRYLVAQGSYFTLTATFEKPSFYLYQVTARLTPQSFALIKAHALTLPAVPSAGAAWQNDWLGLAPKLTVSRGNTARQAVVARFVGLLPRQKFIVLTRSDRA